MDDPISDNDFYSGAGGEVDECALTLRFFGDELDPATITALLGVQPTESCRKGDPVRASHTGRWLLECERTDDTAEHQVELLLSDLSDDLNVWRQLGEDFLSEIKCHLFLKRWTRGTIFSAKTLGEISARNLNLHVEIYMARPLAVR